MSVCVLAASRARLSSSPHTPDTLVTIAHIASLIHTRFARSTHPTSWIASLTTLARFARFTLRYPAASRRDDRSARFTHLMGAGEGDSEGDL